MKDSADVILFPNQSNGLLREILVNLKKMVPGLTDEMAVQVEKKIRQDWGGKDHENNQP